MPEPSPGPFVLPAVLDLDAIEDVRDRLIASFDQGSVTVRADRVERVSTNALLLLASAGETARRSNLVFRIEGASPPMLAAMDRLGFVEAFSPMLGGN